MQAAYAEMMGGGGSNNAINEEEEEELSTSILADRKKMQYRLKYIESKRSYPTAVLCQMPCMSDLALPIASCNSCVYVGKPTTCIVRCPIEPVNFEIENTKICVACDGTETEEDFSPNGAWLGCHALAADGSGRCAGCYWNRYSNPFAYAADGKILPPTSVVQ